MSGFSSFFRTKKPKRFNFTNRYYDEKKERLKKAEERIQRELEYEKKLADNPELAERERGRIHFHRTNRMEEQKKSNQRLIVIIGVLALIAYIVLQYI